MGLFRRKNTPTTSPYACEAAIESTSSFGSISHTPAMSRAHLPLTEEPDSVSSLSSASYAHLPSNLGVSGNGRRRPRLHTSASAHNLYSADAPPLPSLPAHYHSQSLSYSYGYLASPPVSPPSVPHYVLARSTPNLLQQPMPNAAGSSPTRLGNNKDASASRVSLASAGRSLARVPSLWKQKFRRSRHSTNSDASDSSRESKRHH